MKHDDGSGLMLRFPATPQSQACSPDHGRSGWFSQTHPPSSQRVHPISLQVLAQAAKERVPNLALSGFRPVFDFSQQLGLDPDTSMTDPLGVGLRFSDQWRQPRPQHLGAFGIEAMVHLPA